MSDAAIQNTLNYIREYNRKIYALALKLGADWYENPDDVSARLEADAAAKKSTWQSVKDYALSALQTLTGGAWVSADTVADVNAIFETRRYIWQVMTAALTYPKGSAERAVRVAIWRTLDGIPSAADYVAIQDEIKRLKAEIANNDYPAEWDSQFTEDEIAEKIITAHEAASLDLGRIESLYNLALSLRSNAGYLKGLSGAAVIVTIVIIGLVVCIPASIYADHIGAGKAAAEMKKSERYTTLDRLIDRLGDSGTVIGLAGLAALAIAGIFFWKK